MPHSLFGKPISLWRKSCAFNGTTPSDVEPFINLYIRVTDACNASCRFCCNGGSRPCKGFNSGKFEEVLQEIGKSGIRLNRINLTGGELSTRCELVEDILGIIGKSSVSHFSQVQIQTNGISRSARQMMGLTRVDAVALSLHHYDFARLSEIYGCNVPSDLLELPRGLKSKISLSCNLIKGYIDNPGEIEKMLRFAVSKGYNTIGFAGLMKLNDYCLANYVDPWKIDFASIPGLIQSEEKTHEGACRCRNYLYIGGEKPLTVYVRETIDTDYCGSSLLFDGEYLRQGFNKNNIIY